MIQNFTLTSIKFSLLKFFKNTQLVAKFERRYHAFAYIPELSPDGGSITISGNADQDYLYFGESISFTANQLDHWEFKY